MADETHSFKWAEAVEQWHDLIFWPSPFVLFLLGLSILTKLFLEQSFENCLLSYAAFMQFLFICIFSSAANE